MSIVLSDNGTLDTVLRCEDCGEEFRYNYEVGAPPTDAQEAGCAPEDTYDDFVQWAIEDAESEHECSADDVPTEPGEDDITTRDHASFYQYGKLVLQARHTTTGEVWYARKGSAPYCTPLGRFATVEQAIKAFMVQEQFWPSVWFISDHGNAHLMDLTEGK